VNGEAYATLHYRLGYHLPLAQVGLVLNQIWGPSLVLFVVAVALFPDGRLPSGFWRWAFRVYGVLFAVLLSATAVAIVGALAAHPVRVDSNGGLVAIDHPVGWFHAVQSLLIVSILADPDAVRVGLAGVVHTALEPTHLSVWLGH